MYCSVQDDDPVVFQVTTDGPNFSVDLEAGQYLVCDVYNIAEDLSGVTPTPVPDDDDDGTDTPDVVLPNTGSGLDMGSGTPAVLSYLALVALLCGFGSMMIARRGAKSARR